MAPAAAGADPSNLIQNGTFGSVAPPTSTFEGVDAGNSTTISDWTVVTPSIYEGTGSVDVVSKHYWNAETGKYSIDLAGSTHVPGGIYQDVATTPGVEYSLSFWSAVNGYEKPGIKHTMDVTVNGSELDTVKAKSVGRPLDWVQNTATFFASSATSEIEFADATPNDTDQGPTLDNVSLSVVPDDLTASPVLHPATDNRRLFQPYRWPRSRTPIRRLPSPTSPRPSHGATAVPAPGASASPEARTR